MKRKAFTLMEILLTIGIVGIIGTLLARVISGIMPDINKAKFLRAYTASRTIVRDMINDSSLYPDEDTTSVSYGFSNTDAPTKGIYASSTFSGSNKFPLIFADKLGISASDVKTSGSTATFYSIRDNIEYSISGTTPPYTIKYSTTKSNNETTDLGGITVSNDGEINCIAGTVDYCTDMTDLRRSF